MYRKRLALIALLLGMMFMLAMAGCSQEEEEQKDPETLEEVSGEPEIQEQEPLEISETSLFLKSGETAALTVNREDVTFTVKDETVATVDSNGTVTAVAHGTTYVTVASGEETVTCGILVDVLDNDSYVSIEGKSMKPVIYEKELIKWTILQNWDYVPETGDYFFIQQYDTTPSDDIVTRMYADGTEAYMRFLDAGHGNIISVEYVDDDHIYLWLNANGDVSNAHDSFMRVLWEDGGIVDNDAEQTWTIEGMTYSPYVVVDAETRLVLVVVKQGTKMNFQLYDLDSMLERKMVLLTSFQITLGMEDGVIGYYSLQGLCLNEDYIYFLEGGPGTNVYVSVLDLTGQVLSTELVNGYETITYREPEGIRVIDGVVYVGIGSGESGDRRASVFELK